MPLRLVVTAKLIEHGALGVEDAPIWIVGGVGAAQGVERLVVFAGIGQRPPVGAEQLHVAGVADRSLLQYGDRLGALLVGAQRLGIGPGGLGIARIGLIAGAQGIERAAHIGFALRRGRAADRAGGVVAGGFAAARRQSEQNRKRGGSKQMGTRGRSAHGTRGWPCSGVPEQ